MNEAVLNSWKEIAKYLGLDIKTCQRYEKNQGLPVHRLPDMPRSRVLAYKNELDEWRKNRFRKCQPSSKPIKKQSVHKKPAIIVFSVLGISIIAFVIARASRDTEPSGFKIVKSTLAILNEQGKEIWRFNTGLEDLQAEAFFKSRFQTKGLIDSKIGGIREFPALSIKDINRDGHNEVVFAPQTRDEWNSGTIMYFDHQGNKTWELDCGREIKFGQRVFSSEFVSRFIFLNIDKNEETKILSVSHCRNEAPTRILLFNHKREILGEYWNYGQIADILEADLNQDGKMELLLAGQNNEFNGPCLIVLDPQKMSGGSPQGEEFLCPDISKGSEKFYIRLPMGEIDNLYSPGVTLQLIDILETGGISGLVLPSALKYEFNPALELRDIFSTHQFVKEVAQALREEKVKKEFDDKKEIENLKKRLLYYDGKDWVSYHAMSNPW